MAMAIEIPTLIPFSGIDLNGYSSAYIEVAAEIGGEVEVEIEESINETARQREGNEMTKAKDNWQWQSGEDVSEKVIELLREGVVAGEL